VKFCCDGFRLVRSAVLFSAVLGVWAGLACRLAPAQDAAKKYEELPSDTRKGTAEVGKMLTAGTFQSNDEEDAFRAYYTQFFLPRGTEEKFCSLLPEFRRRLHNDLAKKVRDNNTQVHDLLSALVLDYMNNLANNHHPMENRPAEFRPIVRINAMLIIGELNAVESPRPGVAPTPLPEALPVLLKNIDAPKQLEAVKVAAMVGVFRHLSAGINNAQRPQVVATILKALKTPDPPGPDNGDKDADSNGDGWLQARAADAVGFLGAAGDDGTFASALAALAGNGKASFRARCEAAKTMKTLKFNGPKNNADWAAALGRLALDAANAEGASANVKRLHGRLADVLTGLAPVLGATDAAHRPGADALRAAVERLSKADKDAIDEALKDGRKEIEKALKALKK
jgi:hypothetical protein